MVDGRIDRIQRRCSTMRGLLSLAGGLPAEELFPRRKLAEAFLSVAMTPASGALQYGWPEGDEALRRFVAERLRARGADVSPDDVIVTNGAQQALAVACELLEIAGKRIAVDPETYPGALDLFRARGAEILTSTSSCDVAYVVPGASNPRGVGLSAERRRALLASGALVIADEAYAELRFDGVVHPPLVALARDRVLHVGTLSKTLCPGLRIGWMTVPQRLKAAAVERKREMDLQAGSMAQAVAAAYLSRDDYDAHVARARRAYASRAERLVRALRRELPSLRFVEPEGGFAVFVETDLSGVDEARALEIGTENGVSFDPGSMFRASGAADPFAMRLSCSQLAGAAMDEAVKRLARTLRVVRSELALARTA